MEPRSIFAAWSQMLEAGWEAPVAPLNISWELVGEQGGTWTTRLGAGDAPRCDVRMTVSDFKRLLEGAASPQELFLSGVMQVAGEREALLRFHRALKSLRSVLAAEDKK